MTDDDIRALVAEEAPYFRRLDKALRERGFTMAAYISEHTRHILDHAAFSFCDECVADTPFAGQEPMATYHYEVTTLPGGRVTRKAVLDGALPLPAVDDDEEDLD